MTVRSPPPLVLPAPVALSLGVLAFVLLTAICARIEVPMTPVPMTMQTFAVLLAGAALGPVRGVIAILLYLVLAALGLPLLSDGASGVGPFTGATAGYLVAFPIAAGLAGAAARQGWLDKIGVGTAVLFGLHLVILGLGTAWLAGQIGVSQALAAGFTPFLIGAAVKSLLVLAALKPLRRLRI